MHILFSSKLTPAMSLSIVLMASSGFAVASTWENWFLNQDQQANRAFKQGEYERAAELFSQDYQRGVSLYRAGKYAEAASVFSQINDPEQRLNAQYNLGNAEFKQNEFAKAIANYESVLSQDPDHVGAKQNLALAKTKLQEEQAANSNPDSHSEDQGEQGDQKNKDGESDPNQAGNQASQNSPQQQQGNQQSKDSKTPGDAASQAADAASQSGQNGQNGQNSSADRNNVNDDLSAPSPESSTSEADKNGQNALQEQLEQALAEAQQQMQNDGKSAEEQATKSSETAGEKGKVAQQSELIPAGDEANGELSTNANVSLPQEQDLMADALLNQLLDDPGVLLKQQFRLDAFHSQKMPSGQPW